MVPIKMPMRDDRHAVWTHLDTTGTGILSFEQIERAVVQLFHDRAWHKSHRKRALALACQSVELSREGVVQVGQPFQTSKQIPCH